MTEPQRHHLIKVTFNLTSSADDALSRLTAIDGNRTDAINRAIKVAALLHELAPDGRFTIAAPDGTNNRIYLI
ncbi:hypothetical protein [Micromonospora sp. NPDC004704]